jgi:hypothetical protein
MRSAPKTDGQFLLKPYRQDLTKQPAHMDSEKIVVFVIGILIIYIVALLKKSMLLNISPLSLTDKIL